MKKFVMLFLAGLLMLTFLSVFAALGSPVHTGAAMAITNTPADTQPTLLPTEFLTATPPPPTAVPTNLPTAQPTITPAPTRTPRDPGDRAEPTAAVVPVLGLGDDGPFEFDPSSPITRIQIPAIGLDSLVSRVPYREGDWDISRLGEAVGWLENTSQPQLGGNTVVVGHLNLKGGTAGPFARLDKLKPGMEVIVTAGDALIKYQVVQWAVTSATDLTPLAATNKPRLTLITCYQRSWDTATQTYLRRWVVVAKPLDGD